MKMKMPWGNFWKGSSKGQTIVSGAKEQSHSSVQLSEILRLGLFAAVLIVLTLRPIPSNPSSRTWNRIEENGWSCDLCTKYANGSLYYLFKATDVVFENPSKYQKTLDECRNFLGQDNQNPKEKKSQPGEHLAKVLKERPAQLSEVNIRFFDTDGYAVDELKIPICCKKVYSMTEELQAPTEYEGVGKVFRSDISREVKANWKVAGLPMPSQ